MNHQLPTHLQLALSLEAYGFLMYLVDSVSPTAQETSFKPNVAELREQLKLGKHKFYKLINELEERGYLVRNFQSYTTSMGYGDIQTQAIWVLKLPFPLYKILVVCNRLVAENRDNELGIEIESTIEYELNSSSQKPDNEIRSLDNRDTENQDTEARCPRNRDSDSIEGQERQEAIDEGTFLDLDL